MGYAHVGHAVPLRSDGTFDDEAIAENYAAGLYGDGDYVPVVAVGNISLLLLSCQTLVRVPGRGLPPRRSSRSSTRRGQRDNGRDGARAGRGLGALRGERRRRRGGGGAAPPAMEARAPRSESGGDRRLPERKQAAADAVSKLLSSEMQTMSDFLSGDAVVHHTEAVYLEVLRKAVDAASDLASELDEEERRERRGRGRGGGEKAAEAAQELIKEAQR